ncbi:ABC transporter permease [Candidatus Woesearchaeota archaeon]|nr:ABC transporter permease [Candidatus Woesearchaeota archaeon]
MDEMFMLAMRNLWRNKRRSLLTMLGVFIGIAAVVALISLGQGLQQTLNNQFEKIGADKIFVQAKEIGFTGEFAPGKLTEHELKIVRKVRDVKEAAGELFRPVQVQFKGVQRTTYVISLPSKQDEAELVKITNGMEIEQGRFLTGQDANKALIGYNLGMRNTFQRNIRVGDKIFIGGKEASVVGILKRTGDPSFDGSIVIPEDDARLLLHETTAFSYILVQSANGADPEAVANDIEHTIRKDRNQKTGKEDFTVQSSTELIASFNTVFNIIQIVFIGIAAISLLVASVGIMNTMFTTILERTKEIGIIKAIGAKNHDILRLFLFESGMIGLLGGAIGILIGLSMSKGVELFATAAFGPGSIVAAAPWYLIVGALLFSLMIGLLGGYVPARQASLKNPVDALRYE